MAKKKEEAVANEKEKKVALVANTSFNDKYTATKYEKETKFIIADIEGTEKVSDKEYKISKKRAEEIKAKGFLD